MSHWDFLELKVGKDIVRYIIQPYLLPVNGMTIKEKRHLLHWELKTVCTFLEPNHSETMLHMMKYWQKNVISSLYAIKVKRTMLIRREGCERAQYYKRRMLSALDMYFDTSEYWTPGEIEECEWDNREKNKRELKRELANILTREARRLRITHLN